MIKVLAKFFLLIIILLAIFAGYLAYALLVPTGSNQQKLVLLRPGSSTWRISKNLREAGVIRSRTAFLLLRFWKPKPLKAGEYAFDHRANALEVYDRLARGDIYTHEVTIPEGYNRWEIAAAMETAGLGTRDEILKATQDDRALVSDLDPQATSLEGYLFPDTYRFTRTQSVPDMLAAMVHRFRQTARELGITSDVHQIVTMASIVEKETAAPDERPLIANVYYNRLNHGIAFDADPTVIYAALLDGRYRGTIYQSDLQSTSPYNTYRHAGMPPGPIANPGKASLQAALHPAQSNYLYFVSDNNGHHRFARTIEEHDHNVAMYRRRAASH